MSPSPEASSPASDALSRLQREAEYDDENIYLPTHRTSNHPSFGKAGSQLRKWRNSSKDVSTPRKELTYADMHIVFPSVHAPFGPIKPKQNRWEAHQLRQHKSKRKEAKAGNAVSDMGLFSRLPGELRNYIYRLAFVPAPEYQPVLISGSDLICGTGACVHKHAPIAAPAIASTCQQIRNELMPIYCTENAFKFDAVMVRNRCVGNWAKSMNTYARMVRKVTLEILVLNRNYAAGGTDSLLGDIVVECPADRVDGRFELSFDDKLPKEKVEVCGLQGLVDGLNDGEAGLASKLAFIVGSDELAELVFRCRK
ncbi:hypothetical protein LTR36_010014 [Oleoguttula mirabilis]|uniref:Uncharacterized protein n=1 Tax=Oleoguttula mirabilis TaxID=1507867 RepID=A0AAV9JSC5_9PEZI|nr:hypothetical protein LTR36_010014 [Oleoguttula mirabilis]